MNGGYSLTYNEARKILHPNTTLTALAEIEYYAGFNGEEAKRKMVDEACLVACEALDIVSKHLKFYILLKILGWFSKIGSNDYTISRFFFR